MAAFAKSWRRGGHDDIANAGAGSLVLASKLYGDGRDFRQRRERRGLDLTPTLKPTSYSPGGEPSNGWMAN
jgi:hypothetical protein